MGDWAFQYDTLNRLTVAAPALNVPTSYQKSVGCFNYDGFGNRTLAAFTTSSDCSKDTTATATYNSSNQVIFVSQAAPIATSAPSGFSYDAAGNVTADANNSYAYDGEGRLCAVYNSLTKSYTRYVYDASGGRVEKAGLAWVGTGTATLATACGAPVSNSSWTLTPSAYYLLDQGGDQVTELNTSSGTMAWAHSNVWAGSHLDATYDAKGLHFHLADPLGTRRIQTNIDGAVEESCQSLPFGDNLSCATTALATADDATEHHFTGKERDSESGNDYFGARYYSSSMGRFMSPDWSAKVAPVPYAKLDNPQSLNLYAYVLNNPLTGVDADGHCDKNGMLCQAWTWLTSNHSASASASATAAQGSASNGPISATAKMGTAQASASASYGTNTSVSAKASATLASTTINEGTHSTTQVDSHTVNAHADAGVSLGGKNGFGVSASAGANADVLSASQTETIKIGPVTITGTATGSVGAGANASPALGTGGVSASAGLTWGYGGALSLGVSWGGIEASGGASAKGDWNKQTTSVDKPEVK